MKFFFKFKILFSYTIITAFFLIPSSAQISVSYSSAENAVNNLLGSGIQLIPNSISYTGHTTLNPSTGLLINRQLGIFSDQNNTVGISNGVILSTGDVIDIPTNNNASNSAAYNRPGDPDLFKLSSPQLTKDAVILEFDFKPGGTAVSFEFIFASDEYTEHLSNGYFDAFGLFISGPGIAPDLDANNQPLFTNAARNLAKVPNSNTPITAGTINPFNGNSQYYISGNQSIEFDGYTTILTANIGGLTCDGSATYHLKIAIADVQDDNVDAWVLINSKSLETEMFVGDFSTIPPLCEGQQYNISITGDNSYIYSWSNGGSTRSTSFTPTLNMSQISVTVTDPITGCSITKSKDIGPVHTNQNVSPTCGVFYDEDGTPIDVLYVKIGETFCKDLYFTPPESNENITFNINNAPFGIGKYISGDNSNLGMIRLCWTPQASDIGNNCFSVTITDNNACETKTVECEYCIKVICPACQFDVFYENKSLLVQNPLPDETIAGRRIVAGYDIIPTVNNGNVVITSSEQIIFRAGESILLKDGFLAEVGSSFTALIDPNACINPEDCDCCRNWAGFSHDIFIPNVITPNSDGINDYWGVYDYSNPNCAYRAQCFEMEIYDRGLKIFNRNGKGGCPCKNTMDCCPFKSPSSPFDQTKPSIFWDATSDITGNKVPDGVYFYIVKLCSPCGESISYTGNIHVIDSDWYTNNTLSGDNDTMNTNFISKNAIEKNDDAILIYPNPSQGVFNIFTNDSNIEALEFEIFNSSGLQIFKDYLQNNKLYELDFSNQAKGIYLVKFNDVYNKVYTKRIVIQ